MKIAGRSDLTQIEGLDQQQGVSNFFKGPNNGQWTESVPHFSRVRYRNVYPGIDLLYHGNQHQLEYDFNLEPHANPGNISLEFSGVDRLSVDKQGDLVLNTAAGELRHAKPIAYQTRNGVTLP